MPDQKRIESSKSGTLQNPNLSDLRKSSDPIIAIACSDVHFSHKPPLIRSEEPDWHKSMRNTWSEVDLLSCEFDQCPIIIAGDLFNHWNEPVELVNYILKGNWFGYSQQIFAIPGQHDVPYHRVSDIDRSAFQTLYHAGRMESLTVATQVGEMVLCPFPWGKEIKPTPVRKDFLSIAVIHAYIWDNSHGYAGAKQEQHMVNYRGILKDYDVAVFGDNHSHFSHHGPCNIWNNGTLMIRKADEVNYNPCVGLIHRSGAITRYYLDTSKDKYAFQGSSKRDETIIDMSGFLGELGSLTEKAIDFVASVEQFLESESIPQDVRNVILKAMETKR